MELMKLRKSEMAPPDSAASTEPQPTILSDLFGEHIQGYAYGGKIIRFTRAGENSLQYLVVSST